MARRIATFEPIPEGVTANSERVAAECGKREGNRRMRLKDFNGKSNRSRNLHTSHSLRI